MSLLNSDFSHVYVEKEVLNHPNTIKILRKLKKSTIVEIDNYREVFCRTNQSFRMQKFSQNLVLACKKGQLVYKGADVCQNFGNDNFYYTSSVINCLYNCEYCYLQGMYPSSNVVIFVNQEDFFREVELLLQKHSVYLCISYDTDLLAIESLTSFVDNWIRFCNKHSDLTIELRTKSSNFSLIKTIAKTDNVILAWTLSPQCVVEKFELGTPSLDSRLESIREAQKLGWTVRLCFDPVLYISDMKQVYSEFIDYVFSIIDASKIQDVSMGVFRISKEYFKKMKKVAPFSQLLSYPFECQNGVYSYEKERINEINNHIYRKLQKFIRTDRIYL